jgi:signal transduction histidine kinase
MVAAAVATVAALAAALDSRGQDSWVTATVIAAYACVAALVLTRQPGHAVGRLMLGAAAVWSVGELALVVAVAQVATDPVPVWAATLGALGAVARATGWLALVLELPLVFPDGRRFGPSRLRHTSRVTAHLALILFALSALLSPTSEDFRLRAVNNPVGLPESLRPLTDLMSLGGIICSVATVAMAVATLVLRWRRDDALVRQQLLWFAIAFTFPVVLFPLAIVDAAQPWMFGALSIPVPIAIAVAVLQHRLYDVQRAVNRSLTYGALSLAIAALYAVVVGGVDALLRTRGAAWLPWVGAGVVAVTFAPLRNALQQAANRLTYGQWAQPADVLAAAGRRLADATDVPGLLHELTEGLATGLRLPYVEVADARGTVLARSGVPTEHDELPFTAYGAAAGVLRWARRPLREADRRLLADVAHQLGGVVHAAGLLDDVREAQERLVLAREEERKRLRRDLHDGLGPALAAMALQVDTVRNRVAQGADVDLDLLRLREGIAGSVADVRRIVEGLRPPALDDLGLAGALDRLAHELGGTILVTVEVAAPVQVPAAVEVAAYRIAAEALSNATRHAGASGVRVTVRSDSNTLEVSVADDGCGVVAPRPGGIGLATMRERAAEIGGRLSVDAAPGRGTTVTARLPLSAAPAPTRHAVPEVAS